MGRVKLWLLRQVERTCQLWRGIVRTVGTLFGIRQPGSNTYEFGQVTIACGVFLFGVPVGLLFLGNSFNPVTWMAVVLGSLWLVNLDHALFTIATMVDYGVEHKEPMMAPQRPTAAATA